MEWTPRPLVEHLREQERHNVTVITVGSKYEVYVRSPASSHMQTLNQPFQTLAIKWEVNIFLNKSSCVLYSCVCYHCVGMYPVYICMQQEDFIPVFVRLVPWSLLTVFCILNSGFLTAILPYRPASQSLLLTVDVETFFHGIGSVVHWSLQQSAFCHASWWLYWKCPLHR